MVNGPKYKGHPDISGVALGHFKRPHLVELGIDTFHCIHYTQPIMFEHRNCIYNNSVSYRLSCIRLHIYYYTSHYGSEFTHPNIKSDKIVSWNCLKDVEIVNKQDYVEKKPRSLREKYVSMCKFSSHYHWTYKEYPLW